MRIHLVFLLLCATSLLASEPDVRSVDHDNPSTYLAFPDSLGDRAAIAAHASKLKGDSDLATIRNVLSWMDRNLRYDAEKAYSWRNYDDVMRETSYGGCADYAIVCGVLLKGAGIPVVWVKTMDVAWIWDFKRGRPFQSWSGHVFLEVYVDRKWMLLDPGAKVIYKDYSTRARILPGNRFAYHKGNDPKKMIMSLQWEEWKRQTETYFRDLEESLLPVDPAGGTHLAPQAFVLGNSPYYQAMGQMAAEAGLTVIKSFNAEYDAHLPQARGHVLLIETHNGTPIVVLDLLEKHFPGASQGLQRPDGIAKVGETTIVFLDFSKPLGKLKIRNGKKK